MSFKMGDRVTFGNLGIRHIMVVNDRPVPKGTVMSNSYILGDNEEGMQVKWDDMDSAVSVLTRDIVYAKVYWWVYETP